MRASKAPAPSPRRVAAEDLNVAPWVQELPLATPRRRFWAMAIDLLLVTVVSAMLVPDRHSAKVDRDVDDDEDVVASALAPAPAASSSPDATASASAASRPRHAASTMTPSEALAFGVRMAAVAASAASAADAGHDAAKAATDAALAEVPQAALVRQIRSLEKELAEARRPKAWYERGWHWFRGLVTGYGGMLVYFTLVPAFWRGQTVGKRLLGLRIVEITGKPMNIRLAFARYGGYVAGMVTGGFGLAQVLWDRNRQGLQDKVAHTIVVDERAAAKARGA